MRITESQLRSIVRDEILREWTIGQALMMAPESSIQGLIEFFRDAFGPSEFDRLERAGDNDVLDRLGMELGLLYTTPDYRVAWENYKVAQRQHRSMDGDYSEGMDSGTPVGKALARLRARMFKAIDDAENKLSPQNKQIWQPKIQYTRDWANMVWDNFDRRKITVGGLLRMIDPKGVVESKGRRGLKRISEAGEMFAGRDLEQMQTTEMVAALETALMDLEDVGCPMGSAAHTTLDTAIGTIEKMRNSPDFSASMLPPVVSKAIYAVKTCRQIPPAEASRIAVDLEIALDRSQEIDRY